MIRHTGNSYDNLFTLEEFLIQSQNSFHMGKGELYQLLHDIGLASKIISKEVNKAGITNVLGLVVGQNVHGELVKELDLFANEQLISVLRSSDITCMVISEENQNVVRLSPDSGKYIVYLDPVDGSSNIDVNGSIGSIFSIYKRDKNKNFDEQDALQKGRNQVAAGYTLYGSSTMLVYTTGQGVQMFTLDPGTGEYIYTKGNIKIPQSGRYYSINEGSYNTWGNGLKQYIKYCQADDFSTGRPHTSRYIGSMVADIHRTIFYGGIFIYPNSSMFPDGKLRLMYECNPLGFIIEQAGGMAINGEINILDITPESIHQQTPIYIGSRKNVEKLKRFLLDYR